MRGRGLDEGGDTASGNFLAERDGEGIAAHFVHIVRLGVAGFTAAVNHIVELFAIGSVEDAREMFCGGAGEGKNLYRGGNWPGHSRSRLASAWTNLSLEHASSNSGANQANCGRTLSTKRTSEARLFSWMYSARCRPMKPEDGECQLKRSSYKIM